jgi:NAD(P)-dependent dehydrogenase (short-subunit alcohol dehydrogenase family)
MLKKETGNIVFVLPPNAVTPSVEYYRMGVFAVIGLIKGLALQYAPQGIVINGIVLGEQKMYQAIAEWVIFLASGNSRNIIGELIILD